MGRKGKYKCPVCGLLIEIVEYSSLPIFAGCSYCGTLLTKFLYIGDKYEEGKEEGCKGFKEGQEEGQEIRS